MPISNKDKTIMRDLAKRVAEIGHDPQQSINKDLWKKHNALQRTKPMVLVFPEGSWSELLPHDVLQCEDSALHGWEWYLRHIIYRWENLRDDNVIEPRLRIGAYFRMTGWGVDAKHRPRTESRGSWGFEPVIKDSSDLQKLRVPTIEVDEEETRRTLELAHEVFDGILPVSLRKAAFFDTTLLTPLCELIGLDDMYSYLTDRPEFVHEAMSFMTNATLELMDKAEREGWVEPNNQDDYVGSGGVGYTDELPAKGSPNSGYTYADCWGFACAQEFSLVSPQMHYEFVLQYQIKMLERFGLNCYACCEPVSDRFDIMFKIPRLRRLSISPWADIYKSADALQDKVIFSWKPNPADLASETFNPDLIRDKITECVNAAKGCVLEIIMKDTHTVRNEPHRMSEWVRIAKEIADEGYPE